MDHTGDSKVMWNRKNPDEVAIARRTWDDLKAKRYTAYKPNADGSNGAVVTEFDPAIEALVFVPPLGGG